MAPEPGSLVLLKQLGHLHLQGKAETVRAGGVAWRPLEFLLSPSLLEKQYSRHLSVCGRDACLEVDTCPVKAAVT